MEETEPAAPDEPFKGSKLFGSIYREGEAGTGCVWDEVLSGVDDAISPMGTSLSFKVDKFEGKGGV